MKFLASRTSEIEGKPCPEALRESFVRVDERTYARPEDVPMAKGESEWWYEEGRNHRVENGRIRRDMDDEDWFIEFDTLEELVEFARRHGSIIIKPFDDVNPDTLELEIYNGYRE